MKNLKMFESETFSRVFDHPFTTFWKLILTKKWGQSQSKVMNPPPFYFYFNLPKEATISVLPSPTSLLLPTLSRTWEPLLLPTLSRTWGWRPPKPTSELLLSPSTT